MADPKYRQIADDLRRQIESGELAPDSLLPPEIELREQYAASRNTIRDAVKSLVVLGLVETRPGQGTFVARQLDPFVTMLSADQTSGLGGGEGAAYLSEVSQEGRSPASSRVRVEVQRTAGEIAARMRVPGEATLVSRHEQRLIDGIPWSLQTSFYPLELATRGAQRLLEDRDIEQGTVRYLEEALGLRQVDYQDWITVRTPDQNEIAFFGLPADGRISVFEIFRTAFDQNGEPMRVTVSVFPADRNQFIVDIGKVPALTYQ